jgi:uncharacterized membrane protein
VTLEPLLNASPIIKVHAFAAMSAMVVGAVQIFAPKGTISHRKIGWVWVALIMTMLLTAPIIHGASLSSLLSPAVCYEPAQSLKWNVRCASIHLLTVYLIFAVPFGPLLARRGYIKSHRTLMIGIWVVALVIAGAFTTDTHRIMHSVLFGPSPSDSSHAGNGPSAAPK